MKKLTPVLMVDSIEEQLPFWCERLGFEAGVQVPHEDAIGFAILTSGSAELMLQSRASVAADVPAMATGAQGMPTGGLFIESERPIDEILPALEGLDQVMPRRTTFYGADEVVVRAPDGSVVVVAHFADRQD